MDSAGNERSGDGADLARRLEAQQQGRVVYLLNPADDVEFRTAVEAARLAGVASPSELQARLRPAAPRVVVRRRELDAEPVEVWYVYRDGHWILTREDR